MTVTPDAEHVAEALALLLYQFKDKDRIGALLSSWTARVQDFETAILPLLTLRSIDDSVGAQLDGLGSILSQPRNADDDTAYRISLKVRLLVLRSSGTGPQLIEILATALGAQYTPGVVQAVEGDAASSATFQIWIHEPVTEAVGLQLGAVTRAAKLAGVGCHFQFYTTETPFTFDGDDVGAGFDDGDFAGSDGTT